LPRVGLAISSHVLGHAPNDEILVAFDPTPTFVREFLIGERLLLLWIGPDVVDGTGCRVLPLEVELMRGRPGSELGAVLSEVLREDGAGVAEVTSLEEGNEGASVALSGRKIEDVEERRENVDERNGNVDCLSRWRARGEEDAQWDVQDLGVESVGVADAAVLSELLPVVGSDQHDGVVEKSLGLQGLEEASYLCVRVMDLSRIGLFTLQDLSQVPVLGGGLVEPSSKVFWIAPAELHTSADFCSR
jgi:hypothetical protein